MSDGARRLAWGWRLLAYFALLVTFTVLLQVVVLRTGLAEPGELDVWTAGSAAVGALLASWVMMSKVESRAPAALGLLPGRRAAQDFALGAAVGVVLVGATSLLLLAAGWVHVSAVPGSTTSWFGHMVQVTVVLSLAAFSEEIAVRGYPFQVLAERAGPVVATLATAALFAALHGLNPGVGLTAFANTFLAGILLGIMYWKTLSLWLVTGAHVAWNWTMGVAVGLPVSGIDLGSGMTRASLVGPPAITGGTYGLEGGWLLGLFTVAGMAWVARTPRMSRDPAVVALEPLPCGDDRRSRPALRMEIGSADTSEEK